MYYMYMNYIIHYIIYIDCLFDTSIILYPSLGVDPRSRALPLPLSWLIFCSHATWRGTMGIISQKDTKSTILVMTCNYRVQPTRMWLTYKTHASTSFPHGFRIITSFCGQIDLKANKHVYIVKLKTRYTYVQIYLESCLVHVSSGCQGF